MEAKKEILLPELDSLRTGKFAKENILNFSPTVIYGLFRGSRKSTIIELANQARGETFSMRKKFKNGNFTSERQSETKLPLNSYSYIWSADDSRSLSSRSVAEKSEWYLI